MTTTTGYVEEYNGFRIFRGDTGYWACASWDSRIQLENVDIYHLRHAIRAWWDLKETR